MLKKIFIAISFFTILSQAHADLKIGTTYFDPPYVLSTTQGFEIDLMNLICAGLGVKCKFIPMSYNNLFTAITNGQIDLAVDGIDLYVGDNPLNGNFIYSLPYLLSQGQIITLNKNPSMASLKKGCAVGLVQETNHSGSGIYYTFFQKHYGKKFTIKPYLQIDKLIEALSDGSICAAFIDDNQANYWLIHSNGIFKAISQPEKVADGIGIVANSAEATLIAQINQQIIKIENSPKYIQLYNTYIANSN
ncbi:MAG: hypothetical protein A3F18_03210 [Legionellales bacterium RIFCSPHIGHO2_12_FULL_37_14]|nr:MAG: hypothetical protein A3F18_03210 [Legionellales bacterium RIFCSPHIGHO2_12_FULL_37_14]